MGSDTYCCGTEVIIACGAGDEVGVPKKKEMSLAGAVLTVGVLGAIIYAATRPGAFVQQPYYGYGGGPRFSLFDIG
jgi:hypothetical protein